MQFCQEIEGLGKFPSVKYFKSDILSSKQALAKILSDAGIRSYTWDKLYKRSVFIDHNIHYPYGMYFEDLATTFKLIYYCEKVAVVNEYLYNYLLRIGN